jgi:hypothetical protein
MKLQLAPQPQRVDLKHDDKIPNDIGSVSSFPANIDERLLNPAKSMETSHGRPISIQLDSALKKNDEHKINLKPDIIEISGGTPEGIYYALQTLKQMRINKALNASGVIHDWADLKMRIQHVDLKRLGWNFDYLLGLFDTFSDLKINYVLMEYEDKFKFDFCDKIPAKSAFSKYQIALLEKKARDNFIEIIPLVQSIGHFEYILKHEKYKSIAENAGIGTQACPLKKGTLELFKKMASEIIEMHPSSEFFHIGADEPFELGTCPECSKTAREKGKGKLYIEYINKVIEIIKAKGKRPLIWADILERHDDAADLCSKDAIAVYWSYAPLQSREKKIRCYQAKSLRIQAKEFKTELTETQHKRFDKYFDFNPEAEDFYSLPFGPYLRDLGFDVIGSSCVRFADNILTHSESAKENGLLGNLATYWASHDSSQPPIAIFEARLATICMLASAWNLEFELKNRSSFFKRASAFLNNGNDCMDAVYELLNDTRNIIIPNENNNKSVDYFKILNVALAIEISPPTPHSRILMDFMKKIKTEKELSNFKEEKLKKTLLPTDCFKTVNLKPYANEIFTHTEERPGWSRIFKNDLRFFPRGKQCFNGIPFDISPDSPTEKNAVIMIGNDRERPFFPSSVKGIKIDSNAYCVNFLHSRIEGPEHGRFGKYLIRYEDGSEEEVPLVSQKNMCSWCNILEKKEASAAWTGENLVGANVGLHIFSYFPEKSNLKIETIDFVCESETVLALAGLTLINKTNGKCKEPEIANSLNGFSGRIKKLKVEMKKDMEFCMSPDAIDEVLEISFGYTENYLERMKKIINT